MDKEQATLTPLAMVSGILFQGSGRKNLFVKADSKKEEDREGKTADGLTKKILLLYNII